MSPVIEFILVMIVLVIACAGWFVWAALLGVYKAVDALAKGSPKEHTRWMMANDALNRIEDWLEYGYKSQSAEEQRDTVMEIIDEYADRVSRT